MLCVRYLGRLIIHRGVLSFLEVSGFGRRGEVVRLDEEPRKNEVLHASIAACVTIILSKIMILGGSDGAVRGTQFSKNKCEQCVWQKLQARATT